MREDMTPRQGCDRARERERTVHVHVHRSAQVVGSDREERSPLCERDVVHRDAELGRTA